MCWKIWFAYMLSVVLIGRIFAVDYQLVWQDLFDGPNINESNWNIEYNYTHIPNRELQAYLPGNVSIDNEPLSGESCLVLTAKRESHFDRRFTSGRVDSFGKYSFKYGKIEARIKLPKTANGLWPAFWLLGADQNEVGWPRCSEIDILEMGIEKAFRDNKQEYFNSGCIHWSNVDFAENHPLYSQEFISEYSLQDNDFHLYTMVWDEGKIEMFLDIDKYPDAAPYFSIRLDEIHDGYFLGDFFRKPFYITINLAVGGVFPNIFSAGKITALNAGNNHEAKMYVDYVKVFQEVKNQRPIVFLGDSITSGYNVNGDNRSDLSKSFPAVLDQWLDIPVLNAGIAGNTTLDAFNRLDRDVLSKNPQAVVVFLGINDLFNHHDFWFTEYNLHRILGKLLEIDCEIFLIKFLPDDVIRWSLEESGNKNDEVNYLMDLYTGLFPRLEKLYNAVVVQNIWDDIWQGKTPDGLHPNEEGQRIIAGRVFAAMRPYLDAENLSGP